MHKGEISILMAVYNCEDTIEQSIDSVIAQTYKDWHMIICDDCSTDGTGRIISDYAKNFLRLRQLFCLIPAENKTSVKLFTTNGFVKSGKLSQWLVRLDSYSDVLVLQKFF